MEFLSLLNTKFYTNIKIYNGIIKIQINIYNRSNILIQGGKILCVKLQGNCSKHIHFIPQKKYSLIISYIN